MIHSGSRNLGVRIADHYQDIAYEKAKEKRKAQQEEIIKHWKEVDPTRIHEELQKVTALVEKSLATLEGKDLTNYLDDMKEAQDYAAANRFAIAEEILGKTIEGRFFWFDTVHNYIDLDVSPPILRKGAVSAKLDEVFVVPLNMRDGSLVCLGKGNKDWNESAPHGAGRVMARGVAKRSITMEEFEESMEGIYTTSVNESTIDEAPMAYKPMDLIKDAIGDTAEVAMVLKPIYNFKK